MDSQGCISSTGYEDGTDYPSNDECTIAVPADNTLAIDVIAFNTETYWDYLFVNDVYYDGTTAPAGVVPAGNITWSADAWMHVPAVGSEMLQPWLPLHSRLACMCIRVRLC